jgi:hypothetical protein
LAATLWGWNFGFDFAPSGYRLHASHQQIHQQYAMVPGEVPAYQGGCEEKTGAMPSFSCGDLLAEVIEQYKEEHQRDFFDDYRRAIAANRRLDERGDRPTDLVVWSDGRVMLFVPKAQTSQWELQLMTLPDGEGKVAGNVVECDATLRRSLDLGLLTAQRVLAGLGARMVTSIEYGKRIVQAATTSRCSTPCCLGCRNPRGPSVRRSCALSTATIRRISPPPAAPSWCEVAPISSERWWR